MKISEEKLIKLREQYKPGTRVELISMDDQYAKLKSGEIGTVITVDNIGTIHVDWDCGIILGIAYGEDSCKVVWKP